MILPKALALWTLSLLLLLLHTTSTHAHLLTFSTGIPLYFSVLFLVIFGLFCWTLNVVLLNGAGIPTAKLLDLKKPSGQSPDPPSGDTKRLWALILLLSSVSLVSFYCFLSYLSSPSSMAEEEEEEQAEFIPFWTYILLLLFLLNPTRTLFYKERQEFTNALKRIAWGGLWDTVPFCDVLFADILTSFSRVFGDLQFVISDLMFSDDFFLGRSWLSLGLELLVPFLVWWVSFCFAMLFMLRCRETRLTTFEEASRMPFDSDNVYPNGISP
jgi:hypothetical protein